MGRRQARALGRRLDMVGPGSLDAKTRDIAPGSLQQAHPVFAVLGAISALGFCTRAILLQFFHVKFTDPPLFGRPKCAGVEPASSVSHDGRWLGSSCPSQIGRHRSRGTVLHRMRESNGRQPLSLPSRVWHRNFARAVAPQHHLASTSHVDNGICDQQRYRPGVSGPSQADRRIPAIAPR